MKTQRFKTLDSVCLGFPCPLGPQLVQYPVDRERARQLCPEVFPGQVWKRPRYQRDTSPRLLDLNSTGAGALSCSCFCPSAKVWSTATPVHRGQEWQRAVAWRCAVVSASPGLLRGSLLFSCFLNVSVSRVCLSLSSVLFPPLWDGASLLGMACGGNPRVDRQSLNI